MRRTVFFYLVIFSLPAFAQEVKRITFNEAVTIGLKNNVEIKQAGNNYIVADMNTLASLVDYLPVTPDMQISADYGTNNGNSFNQQEGKVVNGQLDFFGATFGASTTIFNGFNKYNSYRRNQRLEEAQLYNLKWTKETVIGNIATQYLNSLLNKELLKIAETNFALQEEQLNKVKVQVNLGSVAEVEQINQEYQVKNASLELLRAQTNLRNSKTALSQLLLLDPSIQIELVEPKWKVKILPDEKLNVDELISLAIQNRADLKQSEEQTKASHFQMKAARGSYFPSLSAFFNYGSQYNYIHDFPENRAFDQQFYEDNLQKTYGVSLTIPILYGLSTRAMVTEAKVNYENMNLSNSALINDAKVEVLNAYQNYKDALLAYNASQAQLDAAEISFTLEKERFDLGASDLIQYTQANQNYIEAQGDFAQAYYTLIFQDILLSYATGTLSLEDIPE